MTHVDLRKIVDGKLADQRAAVSAHVAAQSAYMEAEDNLTEINEAHEIIQLVAQAVQQEAHSQIAGVVSRCMEAVFDEPYEFKINFDRKRGRTEAALTFVREDLEVDPLTASGGGVVDVASFALRLACLVLARPQIRRLLCLDEPFRFVSKDYRPRVRALMEGLAKEMNVQIIQVTHIDELRCGTVVELGQ